MTGMWQTPIRPSKPPFSSQLLVLRPTYTRSLAPAPAFSNGSKYHPILA